ncbi:MAG: pyridoxamine 5'-phosphate oxidase family protein [Nitrospinae bacterium]|nr:pyridoxamine 5'-phosphate oxidase family protein [Nitrospinota bacterium]
MSGVKNKIKVFFKNVHTTSIATCLNNEPSCRVMEIQKVEDNLTLWFVSHKNSNKIKHLRENSKVSIADYDHVTHCDIRMFGNMTILEDQETKDAVWTDHLSQYFKGGSSDPDYCVLKFTPNQLEYRDMKANGFEPEIENL